jgi:hypothetical protein
MSLAIFRQTTPSFNREAFAVHQTLVDAALQYGFEQAARQIAVAERAMRVLREGQAVGHLFNTIDPKP